MRKILKHYEVISKVFNNNIVMVNSNGKEKILFAKGIGFGKKAGLIIPKGTRVDKLFLIENNDNINDFNQMTKDIDNEFIGVCEECICEISDRLNCEFNERIHIALIDHLYFTVERLKDAGQIENPFLSETEMLYSKEYDAAVFISEKIGEYYGINIPKGEIGFIALHIHSAINGCKVSKTIKNTLLYAKIVEYVEKKLNVRLDKKSIDYARFCTHIKFAIHRIEEKKSSENELIDIIKETYKESYEIAKDVALIIEQELKVKVMEDEIAFLTIHIERFRINKKSLH